MPIDQQADNYRAKNPRSEHPTETELFSYLEGQATQQETIRIEQHLEICAHCFDVVVSVRGYEAHPFTPQELQEAEQAMGWTPQQHAEKLFDHLKKNQPSAAALKKRENNLTPAASHKAEEAAAGRAFNIPAYWRPLAIAATVIFALAAGLWGLRYYQTDYQIAQAEKLLKEQHRIFIKDARLSGGYGSSGISVLMSNDNDQDYLRQTRARVEKALARGAQSLEARRLLAQIFMITKDYARADSLLHTLAAEAEKSPALLNDLGVYSFQQQDWAAAEKYFSQALAAEPRLAEARYNLALVKMQTGAKDEARALLNAYLQIESDENWQNAARGLLEEMGE